MLQVSLVNTHRQSFVIFNILSFSAGKITYLWKMTFPLDWSPPLAAHLHEGSSFVFRLGQDFFLAVKSKYYT